MAIFLSRDEALVLLFVCNHLYANIFEFQITDTDSHQWTNIYSKCDRSKSKFDHIKRILVWLVVKRLLGKRPYNEDDLR